MSGDHAAAFLQLLAADAGLTVYDGKVPAGPAGKLPPRPYVVFYGDPGLASVDTLAGTSGRVDGTHQTTVVGDEADSVRIIQARIRAAVLDRTPDVTGRKAFPIRQAFSNPARPDQDVQPAVLYGTDGWRIATVPA